MSMQHLRTFFPFIFIISVAVLSVSTAAESSASATCVAQNEYTALMDEIKTVSAKLLTTKSALQQQEAFSEDIQKTLKNELEALGKEKKAADDALESGFANLKKHQEAAESLDVALGECSKKLETLQATSSDLKICQQDVAKCGNFKSMLDDCKTSLNTKADEFNSSLNVMQTLQTLEKSLTKEVNVLKETLENSERQRFETFNKAEAQLEELKDTRAALHKSEAELRQILPSSFLFSTEQLKRNIRKVVAVNTALIKFGYAMAFAAIPSAVVQDAQNYFAQAQAELHGVCVKVQPYISKTTQFVWTQYNAASKLYSAQLAPHIADFRRKHVPEDKIVATVENVKQLVLEKIDAVNMFVDKKVLAPLTAAYPEVSEFIPDSQLDRTLAVLYILVISYVTSVVAKIFLGYTICPVLKLAKNVVVFLLYLLKEIVFLPFRLTWFAFMSVFSSSKSRGVKKDNKSCAKISTRKEKKSTSPVTLKKASKV